MGECPYSPEISTGDLNQGWPPWRAGDRTAPHLIQCRVLDATLFPCAPSIPTGLEADATAFVLGLVELAVDDVLEHDEKHAYEDREEGDADVCLEVPFLQCGQYKNQTVLMETSCVFRGTRQLVTIFVIAELLHINKHIIRTCCETYIKCRACNSLDNFQRVKENEKFN